jgi:hypothetical protein
MASEGAKKSHMTTCIFRWTDCAVRPGIRGHMKRSRSQFLFLAANAAALPTAARIATVQSYPTRPSSAPCERVEVEVADYQGGWHQAERMKISTEENLLR